MLSGIFNALKEWNGYHKQLSATRDIVATGTPQEVRKAYTALRNSDFFETNHNGELYRAAIQRDDVDVLFALLPDNNPNKSWHETDYYVTRTHTLLSAALQAGSKNISHALAGHPAIDARAGASFCVFDSSTYGLVSHDVSPAELARKAGMDDVAKSLETRAAQQEALDPPKPAPEVPATIFDTLSTIYNKALQEYREARAFEREVNATEKTIRSGDVFALVPQYEALAASPRFTNRHSNRLIVAALDIDDPAAVFAVLPLPERNPNVMVSHNAGGGWRNDPLISAAMARGAEKTLKVIGRLAETDFTIQSEVLPLPVGYGDMPSWVNVGGPAQVAKAHGYIELSGEIAQKAAVQLAKAGIKPPAPKAKKGWWCF